MTELSRTIEQVDEISKWLEEILPKETEETPFSPENKDQMDKFQSQLDELKPRISKFRAKSSITDPNKQIYGPKTLEKVKKMLESFDILEPKINQLHERIDRKYQAKLQKDKEEEEERKRIQKEEEEKRKKLEEEQEKQRKQKEEERQRKEEEEEARRLLEEKQSSMQENVASSTHQVEEAESTKTPTKSAEMTKTPNQADSNEKLRRKKTQQIIEKHKAVSLSSMDDDDDMDEDMPKAKEDTHQMEEDLSTKTGNMSITSNEITREHVVRWFDTKSENEQKEIIASLVRRHKGLMKESGATSSSSSSGSTSSPSTSQARSSSTTIDKDLQEFVHDSLQISSQKQRRYKGE